ncbi:phospho-N-acetylmuramoyl-pentappeptidetransferase [Mycobacterium tuberculosis variant bovis BCG]|nr:phospho-N-acetylmuramoyl-pentappeptidetransferase [Mycobacterium tuberculosis variant bovis BCG]
MRQILIAVAVAVTVSILLTPVLIRLFTKQGFGHQIREDGPPATTPSAVRRRWAGWRFWPASGRATWAPT